jgi:serine phosphatase RsbU (regulator of sigma subunit)
MTSNSLQRREISSFELNGLRVTAAYEPAAELGGDFYAVLSIPLSGTAILIGDVCGRGLRAAYFAKQLLPSLRPLVRSSVGPADVLHQANRLACHELPEHVFVTASVVWISERDGDVLRLANAGHVPAVLRNSNGATRLIGRPSGPPLGVFADSTYSEERIVLKSGSKLVLMTDGVLEAIEEAHQLFEMPAVSRLVATRGADLLDFVNKVVRVVHSRRQGPDDMTLMTLERAKRPSLSNLNFEAFAGAA